MKKKHFLLVGALVFATMHIGFAQNSATEGAKSISPTVENSKNNTDVRSSATYGAKSIAPVSQPAPHSQYVSATGALQTETTTQKATNEKSEIKQVAPLAIKHEPRNVYTEGKLKGQPIPVPVNVNAKPDPAKQAAEREMLEKRKLQNPVGISNTTSGQAATYKQRREAELKKANTVH